MALLKGIHYSNLLAYNLLTFLKLRNCYQDRFKIAAGYIKNNSSILDLCSGAGAFKEYLPEQCSYECVEMSPVFADILRKNNINCHRIDLHKGLGGLIFTADTAVMLISLCQFRETSLGLLLEELKQSAKKVVIVEDVTQKKRAKSNIVQRIMNYLCAMEYFVPMELFTAEEFRAIMLEHGYAVKRHTGRYYAGYYERPLHPRRL